MKRIFLFAIVCIMSLPVLAQLNRKTVKPPVIKEKPAPASGFYVKLGLGYAFPHAGQTMDVYGNPYSGNATYVAPTGLNSFKIKTVSFAAGVQGLAGIGYMVTKNIGVEINGIIGIANKKYQTVNQGPTPPAEVTQTVTVYAKNPFFAVPSLVLQTSNKKLNIYSRAGIAIPTSLKIMQEYDERREMHAGGVELHKYVLEETLKFNIGFAGATGVKYKVTKYLQISLEAALLSMSTYVKEETLVSYTYNGSNVLNQISPAQRKIKYSNKSGNGAYPAYSYPFSSIGINAGVSLDL